MKVALKHVRSTPGTRVYTNDEIDTPITSLYIKRDALPKKPPKEITVEVTYDEPT